MPAVKKSNSFVDDRFNRPGHLREKAGAGDIVIAEKTVFREEGGTRERMAIVNTTGGSQSTPVQMSGETWTWITRLATMLGHKGSMERVNLDDGRDLKALFRRCPFEFEDADRQHAFRGFLDLLSQKKGIRVEYRWIG